MARRRPVLPGTRSRILAAACDEFGAHGFAATSVDRIARRARVNKAMIYYHFPSKRSLYATIVRELFAPVTDKVRAIAAADGPLDDKLDRLIETLVRHIDRSGYFLPIFLREIADGGVHLGPEELSLLGGIFETVSGVIVEGGRQKVFQQIHPVLAHFTLIGPLVMFRASAPVRARVKAVRKLEMPDADSAAVIQHLQMVARRMLAVDDAVPRT
jgi:TetR/AcrR family transcriptional regulator